MQQSKPPKRLRLSSSAVHAETNQAASVCWNGAEAFASSDASASCYSFSKDVRILAVVVAELKFVQVQRQILLADVMVVADDSAFEQAPERFDVIGVNLAAHVFARTMAHYSVLVAKRVKVVVSAVLVGCDEINLVTDSFTDEAIQGLGVGVLNDLADHVALPADCSDHCGFSTQTSDVLFLVPMAILVFTVDTRFIDFDDAHELFEPFVSQSRTKPVTHEPCRPIGTRADHPVDLHGTDAFFAGQYQVENFEPDKQLVVRVLEDRSDRNGETIGRALGRSTLHALPVERPRGTLIYLRIPATRAGYASRPAPQGQVELASRLVRKHPVKVSKGHLAGNFGFVFVTHATNLAPGKVLVKPGIIAPFMPGG